MVAAKRADFGQIAQEFSIDPVLARVIRNRDVIGSDAIKAYLYGGKEAMHSPWLFKDMEQAVSILIEKIQERKPIRIIGDYDIDGIMSAFILEQGLKYAGANVDVMIPHRIMDGYGLNEHLIELAYVDGKNTILTCDNGITAFEQIKKAKALGMTVIVTDHHEVFEGKIPCADAVVNHKQPGCTYPFKGLCGGAVAYKLICALYEKMGISETQSDKFLEYAAFATIGDVMDLVEENRIIVKEGLKLLRNTKNHGFRELMRVNGIEPDSLSAYHIGFVLGPCMNASGRLDTAQRALELLRTDNIVDAARLAGDLKNLNDSRKELTLLGVEEAILQVEHSSWKDDKIYVIYLPDCHESLAGIIAGRIREAYHHPVFVLTKGEEGVKGSGRSIETYDMFAGMVKCQECFTRFGGHKMAAGLSMEEDGIEAFRKKINALCELTEQDFVPKITIDVPMPVSYVTKTLIEQLELLEPFGKGNTKPVFAQKGVKAISYRIVGKNKNVLTMRLADENGAVMDAICFQKIEELIKLIQKDEPFSIVYYPSVNVFQGQEKLQIIISNFQ